MERVGIGKRFLAGLIDVIVFIVVGTIIGIVTGGGMMEMQTSGGFGAILMFLIFLGYSSLEIFKAATPGKMAMKIQIRNADGSAADQGTLIKRWVFKQAGTILNVLFAITAIGLISTLASLAGLIVFIGCFFVLGQARQAFHDMFAKTAVYPVS